MNRELCISCEKKHKYLDIDLNLTKKGKVKFSMLQYTQKTINKLPEETSKSVETPAIKYLFQVPNTDKQQPLLNKHAQVVHQIVAQLLSLPGQP